MNCVCLMCCVAVFLSVFYHGHRGVGRWWEGSGMCPVVGGIRDVSEDPGGSNQLNFLKGPVEM